MKSSSTRILFTAILVLIMGAVFSAVSMAQVKVEGLRRRIGA
jgi:hypothetical protein